MTFEQELNQENKIYNGLVEKICDGLFSNGRTMIRTKDSGGFFFVKCNYIICYH